MARNDLQSLKELAQVVTRNKVKSINTLSKKGPESKIWDFYEGILNESFASDQDAAGYFYNKDIQHPEYRKLKNKLKERLINTSFFIDVNSPKFNTHQKAFYTCQRNLMAVKILLGRYARTPAIELAEETLRKSIKYEFSDVSFELCKILRSHFAIHSQSHKKFCQYDKESDHYGKLCNLEDDIIKGYEESVVLEKLVTKNELVEICNKYLNKIEPFLESKDSFRLHLWYYFLALRRDNILNNYEDIITNSLKAINYFSKKGFISDQFIGAFYYNQLNASIKIRKFDDAKSLVSKCVQIFEEGSVRWYNAHDYFFIFSLYSRNYRKSIQIREKVVNSKSFKNQYLNRQETWHLFDAFLFYLTKARKINISNTSSLANFRVKKFLNEVPIFSMEKSGRNIPILIIQILIQIQQKKYDQLTDKIEAIEKYATRYLRKDNNYRSNCFIKMLLQIPKQHFHPVAVRRHTKSLLSKLKSMPLEKANQPFEIEIIPYEDLWEMALESIS